MAAAAAAATSEEGVGSEWVEGTRSDDVIGDVTEDLGELALSCAEEESLKSANWMLGKSRE